MYGAVFGDIIGSTYELHNVKTEQFELFRAGSTFTDDTVMSIAVAEKILNEPYSQISSKKSYALWYKQYYKRYPYAGYGQMFSKWAMSDSLYIQKSYGNGAAMRVSGIGFAYQSLKKIEQEVKESCYYAHHHKEAIKGAQAVAAAVFMAKKGCDKDEIRHYIKKRFLYPCNVTLAEIRDTYVFNSRASYSVPPALQAFFESNSYEDAVRKAISIGGDSDTIACMAGGIAYAYYKKIPEEIFNRGMAVLDSGLKEVLKRFGQQYINS